MNDTPSPAPYACTPEASRGRLVPEPESATRTCFQRDRDRIIHSAAFRRLQYKTQVFVNHEGDYFRTRLTHSLEVSQIARSLARSLGLGEYLAETVALAHDLGHTPFGHAGEDVLEKLMADYDGFDHNAQSLRIVTRLEQRYADFDGLNLTWESLEGIVKHNGPLIGAQAGGRGADDLAWAIREFAGLWDLGLDTFASAEAQTAAVADDVAYNNHDIDDGLRTGLFTLDAIREVTMVGETLAGVEQQYPGLDTSRTVHEVVRRLIGAMVSDILDESRTRLADSGAKTPDDIRALTSPVIAFSDVMAQNERELKDFLFKNMYRHDMLNHMTRMAERVVSDLFNLYVADPKALPADWQGRGAEPDTPEMARLVADYIAGMTDRYALNEHRRLFDMDLRSGSPALEKAF